MTAPGTYGIDSIGAAEDQPGGKKQQKREAASAAWLGRDFTRAKPLMWKASSAGSEPALRVENWKFHGTNRKNGSVELYDLATRLFGER